MTNAQMAHKMGIDKVAAPDYAYRDMLIHSGMTITKTYDSTFAGGYETYEAEAETSREKLHILCGGNGTARIDKPNGTHKWVYEKTPNQIAALLRQTIDFYK